MKKVSIVTATYNSSEFIADCIESVNRQTYTSIEHIIVDGASKDNTVAIIQGMTNRVGKLISEPDKGIYNAMNKGLKLATGDIIGILNSDDFYNTDNAIMKVVKAMEKNNTDSLYGNLYYVDQENPDIIKRKWVTGAYNEKKGFRSGWHPAHPSFFVKKSVYETHGYFDETFKIAADFELMLRFLERHRISSTYLNETLVRMRLGGESNKALKNNYLGNKECIQAFKNNNIPVSFLYPFLRLVPKIKQYF